MKTFPGFDPSRFARWLRLVALAFALGATALAGAVGAPPKLDLDKLRAEAAKGNPMVQAALGGALLYGRGVEVDEAEGIRWIKAAVAQDNTLGQSLLGSALIDGKGVPRDPAEGIALLTKAADRGFAPAQAALAQHYFRGEVVARDDKAAAAWARKAAEQGDKDGQRILGALYLAGRGVPQDPAQGEAWLRKAAAQGDELAKGMLPLLPLLSAGAKSPDAQAASVEFVRKNAEAGDAVAQYQLSRLYEAGEGGLPKDQKLAAEWELKAAKQDHPEALGAYGMRLALNRGGVKGDFWRGYSYLYRAGALGHTQSQRLLGLLYQDGSGVKKDLVMSLIWFNAAASTGDSRAAELREKALAQATPQQVAEADRRATAWLKRPPMQRTTPEGAP